MQNKEGALDSIQYCGHFDVLLDIQHFVVISN